MSDFLQHISVPRLTIQSLTENTTNSIDWRHVLEFALKNFEGALAPNTLRAYRADIECYADFCASQSLPPFPASDEILIRYADYLSDAKGQAFATIDRKFNAIARINRFAGFPLVCRSDYFKLQRKKLMKSLGRRQKQAKGLTKDLLIKLEATCDLSTNRGLRDALLLNLAYDTMRRRSELVSLLIEDTEFDETKNIGSILVRRSKTDQTCEGSFVPISCKTYNLTIEWCERMEIKDGPILRSVYKNGAIKGNLPSGEVARILKKLATRAGLTQDEVQEISGHSTRVGAAQDMLTNGKSTAQIMRRGTWKSPRMVMRYTERCGMEGLL